MLVQGRRPNNMWTAKLCILLIAVAFTPQRVTGDIIQKVDFTSEGFPKGWIIEDGFKDGYKWFSTVPAAPPEMMRVALAVTSERGRYVELDERFISPRMDCSPYKSILVKFTHTFQWQPDVQNQWGDVEIRVGEDPWVPVRRFTGEDFDRRLTDLDVSGQAAGHADVQLCWHYHREKCQDNYDHCWWYLFDIEVSGTGGDGRLIYVDSNARGADNGSNWADAYRSLQDALAHADKVEKPVEIRVAQGTYRPDQGGGNTLGDREATFHLRDYVTVQGGYAGARQADPNSRDIDAHETILSGEIQSDRLPPSGNSRPGETFEQAGPLYEGAVSFDTTGAATDGPDTLISHDIWFRYHATATGMLTVSVHGCTFRPSVAVYADGGPLSMPLLAFAKGTAGQGAARAVASVMKGLSYLVRIGGPGSERGTGAITLRLDGWGDNSYNVVTAHNCGPRAVLDGCTITGGNATAPGPLEYEPNDRRVCGGGMYSLRSSPTLINCKFRRNLAHAGGGMCNSQGSPTLEGCQFVSNRAFRFGGGMYNRHADPHMISCRFSDNVAQWTDDARLGQYDGKGGAMGNVDSDPNVERCMFFDNQAFNLGGGVYDRFSNPRFTGCEFVRNVAQVTVNSDPCGYLADRGDGGGVNSFVSCPTFTKCTFVMNRAQNGGGGIYAGGSGTVLTLEDCTFEQNAATDGGGIYGAEAEVCVKGKASLSDCGVLGRALTFTGMGTMLAERGVVSLILEDCRIRCNLVGPLHIQVPLASELVIEADAALDLTGHDENGEIECHGLLRAKDNARISNATITVMRLSFEGNMIVSNSVIEAEAGAPYGQFFVEGSVVIEDNAIRADGDRYLDLDPCDPGSSLGIRDNEIHVTISEGRHNTRGGLLECRGLGLRAQGGDPNAFFCAIDANSMPSFSTTSWTLESLELLPGAKVNLTNRFGFGNGGSNEVMYVKRLVLGEGSVLNTAFNRIYYGDLVNRGGSIINMPLLGFSLSMIEFEDVDEFASRVVHNNYADRENPARDRIHVERVVGLAADPNGVMRMRNLGAVGARAKGLFAKASEDWVLVTLEYLFETDVPGTELMVYLSDVPQLEDPRDPNHYVEVGRIRPPRPGRPGSVGSDRFATFYQYVHCPTLHFVRGTRVELELKGPDGASVLIDDWDPQVLCSMQMCMDFDWSNSVTTLDQLVIVGECGHEASLGRTGEGSGCLDGYLSPDGYVDALDVVGAEWAIDRYNESGSFCPKKWYGDEGLPLTSDEPRTVVCNVCGSLGNGGLVQPAVSLAAGSSPGPLLILAKNDWWPEPDEHIYVIGEDCLYLGEQPFSDNRCVARLVQGTDGELYQINVNWGVLQLHDDGSNEMVLEAGKRYTKEADPRSRYPGSADVYVGLYGSASERLWFGRPIWDAAIVGPYIYVVPVVVVPHPDPDVPDARPYLAAGRVKRGEDRITLYDDPAFYNANAPDNPRLDGLREIEVDDEGNVYVLNAHQRNASDILWKYSVDGSIRRLELGDANQPREVAGPSAISDPNKPVYVPDPLGLCVSADGEMVYVASGQPDRSKPAVARVYAFLTAHMSLVRQIEVNDVDVVTGITEDPSTGTVWVAGFRIMENELTSATRWSEVNLFYEARVARIRVLEDKVQATVIPESPYAVLPLSILWTGAK